MSIIDHGNGLKSKWDMKVYGETPPNPPIEVRPGVEGEWLVVQQRTEVVFHRSDIRDIAVGYATRLAEEHETDLILQTS